MFRVRQTSAFANSLANFLDDIFLQKEMTPQLVAIGASSETAPISDEALYRPRRRRVRRNRASLGTAAVRTGWY